MVREQYVGGGRGGGSGIGHDCPGGAEQSYRKSPFLFFNSDGSVSNFLTSRRVNMDRRIANCLKGMPPIFSPTSIAERLRVPASAILPLVFRLAELKILFPSTVDPFRFSGLISADIEINTNCNANCLCCPVSEMRAPNTVMPQCLFERVLDCLHHMNVHVVSLNHYNEPLLDPLFWQRIDALASRGSRVRLFTNAIGMTASMVDRMLRAGVIQELIINCPSLEPVAYKRVMGVSMPSGLPDIIRYASQRIPVTVCINAVAYDDIHSLRHLGKRMMDQLGVKVYLNRTHDRAGYLPPGRSHIGSNHWSGLLRGCRRMLQQVHIGVEGQVFLCCQDYDKQRVFGNIGTQDLTEIMRGQEATRWRRIVFGDITADDNILCRECPELIRGES